MRKQRLLWIAPMAVVAMCVFILVGGVVVRELWNWLLPPIFGWRQIGWWQAIGLLTLCRILFGGLGWRGMGGGPSGLRRRMEERCASMSPEERERFRQAFFDRWSGRTAPPEPKPNA